VTILGARLDAHTLLASSLALLMGFQSVLFAILSKTYAITAGLIPPDSRMDRFYRVATLERGLFISAVALAAGLTLIGAAAMEWRANGFGPLDYPHTMRWVIPGVTLAALGFQTMLSGFFVSILGMNRR